jgi:hypothetical protein
MRPVDDFVGAADVPVVEVVVILVIRSGDHAP